MHLFEVLCLFVFILHLAAVVLHLCGYFASLGGHFHFFVVVLRAYLYWALVNNTILLFFNPAPIS